MGSFPDVKPQVLILTLESSLRLSKLYNQLRKHMPNQGSQTDLVGLLTQTLTYIPHPVIVDLCSGSAGPMLGS